MLSSFIHVLQYKMLLGYREFEGKYGKYIPFLNKKLYYFSIMLRITLLLIMLEITTLFFEKNLFKMETAYIVVLCFLAFNLIVLTPALKIQDEKYRIFSFFLGGLFNEEEKRKNNRVLILYAWSYHVSVFFIFILFILKTLHNIENGNFTGNLLFHTNILLAIGLVILIECQKYFIKYHSIGINGKKSRNLSSYLLFFLGILVVLFIKMYHIDLFSYFSKGLEGVYSSLAAIIYKEHSTSLNSIVLLGLIGTYILLFKGNLLTRYEWNRFSHNSKETTKIVATLRKKGNPLVYDFIQREVIGKLNMVPLALMILLSIEISPLKKNLILTVIIGFLFTQYNQRYYLKHSFLNYIKMCGHSKRIIIKVLYQLIPLQLLILTFCSLLLNGISLSSFMYLFLNISVFTFSLLINTGIYIVGISQKEVNYEKSNMVELISGIFLITQFMIIVLGSF